MEFGGRLLHHIRAEPLRVVTNALHIIPSGKFCKLIMLPYYCQWSTGSVVPSYDSNVGSLNLSGIGQVWMFWANGDSESLSMAAAELPTTPEQPTCLRSSAILFFISDLSLFSISLT